MREDQPNPGETRIVAGRPPHHNPDGTFRNLALPLATKSLWHVLKWRWHATWHGLPRPPRTLPTCVDPDLPFLLANRGVNQIPTVTWIGHSSVLVQAGGLSLLIDPVFSDRVSPLSWAGPRRHTPPGLRPPDLPSIDLILITHNHYDHLDRPSLARLANQAGGPPRVLAPLGVGADLAGLGLEQITELDWWDSHTAGGLEVHLTPSQHWSGRRIRDRMRSLWGGYALLSKDARLYHAGDTGYCGHFKQIRDRFREGGPFDLALLPIGAYAPRWFMGPQHTDPAEAIRIHQDLGARRSLGIHWGAFQLSDEALDDPPAELEARLQESGISPNRFFTIPMGKTLQVRESTTRATEAAHA